MTRLIRAEWLRLRRRKDVWFVCLALLALAVVAYVSGLSSAQQVYFSPGEDVPPEVMEDIRRSMVDQLALYAFPQSIGSTLQNVQLLLLALLAYLAAALTGAEFAYGTIRTTLVANPDRRRFMGVRLLALAAIAVVLTGTLVLIGAALPFVAQLFGQEWPTEVPVRGGLPGIIGAVLLAAAFVIGLTTAFAVLLRNSAIALVLTVALMLIDGLVHGLVVRLAGGNEQALAAWALPASALQLLFSRTRDDAGLAPDIPTGLVIGIAVAWTVVLWAASVRLMAGADIRD